MEPTTLQKDQLRTIISKIIAFDRDWLKEQAIQPIFKNNQWIVNYTQDAKTEYNYLVRGLIVRKPPADFCGDLLSLIVSFPFIRFFNQNEAQADLINLNQAEMIEKLDGSFVGVYFPTNDPVDPHWHTRRMISSYEVDRALQITGFRGIKTFPLLDEIGKYVKAIDFSTADLDYTYIFEFVHGEYSEILTKYPVENYGLYLIGARKISTHRELSESELDEVAKHLNVRRPRRWAMLSSQHEIIKKMKEICEELPDFEGFVFRDKVTGHRIKVKDPDYLIKHRLLGTLSYKNLVPLVLMGETDEILAYCPQAKDKIDIIKREFVAFKIVAAIVIKDYRDKKLDRKTLAIQLFKEGRAKDYGIRFIHSQVMNLFEEPDDVIEETIDFQLRKIALGHNYGMEGFALETSGNAGSPRRFIEIIGLRNDEEDENSLLEL